MIEEENPYAPPKSSDFRLPELTIKQRIVRILLCVFGISVLSGFVLCFVFILYLIFKFGVDYTFSYINSNTSKFFMSFVRLSVVITIPSLIFSIFLNLIIDKTNKIILKIYALVGGVLIAFISDMFIGKIQHNTFLPYWLFYKTINKDVVVFTIMMTYFSCIMATLVITMILKYKSQKFFRQPE